MKTVLCLQPDVFYLATAFAPVVEPDLPGAFLTEPLEKIIRGGKLHDLPYILGVNTLEGLIVGMCTCKISFKRTRARK